MQMPESQETLVTLANATELATAVALGVVGGLLANQLQGSPLTRDVLCGLAQVKFQQQLSQQLGA